MARSNGDGGAAIGLTGGIGCGKSTVGAILTEEGAQVREADEIAHELMRRGREVYKRVLAAFGSEILRADGEIDREVLGQIVFGDAAQREALNAIVHPEVRRVWREWLEAMLASGKTAVVIIPLLHEVGLTEIWDAVICVAAPEQVVTERLRQRGLQEADIRARIAAQMPLEEKIERSDYVIFNDGDFMTLKEKTRSVFKAILEKERRHHG